MNTECGSTPVHGPDAGSVDQFDTASTEQYATAVSDKIKPEFDKMKPEFDPLSDTVKTEADDAELKKHVAMTVAAAESDANSTVQSESDAPATDVAKQDESDVKSEDPGLKEEDDAMENDEQNADGKQSAVYWNYHWPKVCGKWCKRDEVCLFRSLLIITETYL